MPIHFCIAYGKYHATEAELKNSNRSRVACIARGIYCQDPTE